MHLNSVDDLVACADVALERARKTIELAVMGATVREGVRGELYFQLYSPRGDVVVDECKPLRTIIEDVWTVVVAEDEFIAKSVPEHLGSVDPGRRARIDRLRESPAFAASRTNLKSFYEAVRCGLPEEEGPPRVPEAWSTAFAQGSGYLAKLREQLALDPDEARLGDVIRVSHAAAVNLLDLFERESDQRKIHDVMDEAVASRLGAACADMEIVLDRLKAAVARSEGWTPRFLVDAAFSNLLVVVRSHLPRNAGRTDVKFFIRSTDFVALTQACELLGLAHGIAKSALDDQAARDAVVEHGLSSAIREFLETIGAATEVAPPSEPLVGGGEVAPRVSGEVAADALEDSYSKVLDVWRALMLAGVGEIGHTERLVLRNLFQLLDPLRIEGFNTHPQSRFRYTVFKPGKIVSEELQGAWSQRLDEATRMESVACDGDGMQEGPTGARRPARSGKAKRKKKAKAPRGPTKEERLAYALRVESSTQQEVAETMSRQLDRKITQSFVSRAIKRVKAYLDAGGALLPEYEPLSEITVDPDVLDMGPRHSGEAHRPERQRWNRDPDDDEQY